MGEGSRGVPKVHLVDAAIVPHLGDDHNVFGEAPAEFADGPSQRFLERFLVAGTESLSKDFRPRR